MSAQRVFEKLVGSGSSAGNDTAPLLAGLFAGSPNSLRNFSLAGSLSSGWSDGLLFFVLGGMMETFRLILTTTLDAFRRSILSGWSSLVKNFIFRVHIEKDDEAFDWLMKYFGKQPAFSSTSFVSLSTKVSHRKDRFGFQPTHPRNCSCPECQVSKGPRKDVMERLSYVPAVGPDGRFSFFFGHNRITIERHEHYGSESGLMVSILRLGSANGRAVMTQLLTSAKALHDMHEAKRIAVYLGQPQGGWMQGDSKLRRAWSSIILDEGVKEGLLADATEFLRSQAYYEQRGIPYRRGYLLHGIPGSGKTSLVQALASALNLDIYVIPLGVKGFDDSILGGLISTLPLRCIALIEDIDCAFAKPGSGVVSGSESAKESGLRSKVNPSWGSFQRARAMNASMGPPGYWPGESARPPKDEGVTLSGLLNAIDGVSAHEGRLLFATTNVLNLLDPALIRPGRIDISIRFDNATQHQAVELFKCFFPTVESDNQGTQPSLPKEFSRADFDAKDGVPLSAPKVESGLEKAPFYADHGPKVPALTVAERDALAGRFASEIPAGEFSMATLQGYLLMHKESPHQCVDLVGKWIEEQKDLSESEELSKEREGTSEDVKADVGKAADGSEATQLSMDQVTSGPQEEPAKAGCHCATDLEQAREDLRAATAEMKKMLHELQRARKA